MTTDIDKRLDEIFTEELGVYCAGMDSQILYITTKSLDNLRKAIKQLMADEFEKLTKMYYASPDKSEYQAGYNSALDELRQKLEEWKQ